MNNSSSDQVTMAQSVPQVPIIAVVPASQTSEGPHNYGSYIENINRKWKKLDRYHDMEIRSHLYIRMIVYVLNPNMLRLASTEFLLTWKGSLLCQNIYTNKNISFDESFIKEAIATLDSYLESEGHYNVSVAKFNERYDYVIKSMYDDKRFKAITANATSLIDYMNKAITNIWNDLPLEKKAHIRARVMSWKDLPDSMQYGLIDKCKNFLEKYKLF